MPADGQLASIGHTSHAAPFVERILDRFPMPADLARAELGELLVLWQGLGYPRRARNLWLAAQQLTEHGWPDDLTDLPGVRVEGAGRIEHGGTSDSGHPPTVSIAGHPGGRSPT